MNIKVMGYLLLPSKGHRKRGKNMNLSERGKKIWWGCLVALLIFRIKDLIAGKAGQADVYL